MTEQDAATQRGEVGTTDDADGGLFGSDTGANMAVAAAAELIGTFLLIFCGTAVAVAAGLQRPTAGGAYDSLAVALGFGLMLSAVVAALGHVSGAHVNPAITIGLAITRKFPRSFVPAYLAAQLIGAVLGSLAVWLTFGGAARDKLRLGATAPTAGVGDLRAIAVEALVTFVLAFVVVSVATDKRAAVATAPLAVGFALTAGVLIAGPITGGAVNPARALGPMIVSGSFTSFYVYIVGPIIGGVVAALTYDRFIAKGKTPG
jgi:MIP family channel proteins